MPWNWEYTNWPEFTYAEVKLGEYEKEFLHKAGMLFGSLTELGILRV